MQTPIWAWRSLTHSKHLSQILWSIVNSFEWHCTPSYWYLYCTKSKQISYDMCMISCKTPFYRYNNNFFSDNFSISQMLSIWHTNFFYFWGFTMSLPFTNEKIIKKYYQCKKGKWWRNCRKPGIESFDEFSIFSVGWELY